MPGGASRGFAKGVYGIGRRETLYPGEDDYFKQNPHVAGMAAEDDHIIMNPYSKLSEKERDAVLLNEAARVHMRKGLIDAPRYDLTPEQTERLQGYSSNMDDIRQTLAARILSGDPSAGKATPEQLEYAQRLRRFMGVE